MFWLAEQLGTKQASQSGQKPDGRLKTPGAILIDLDADADYRSVYNFCQKFAASLLISV